MCALYRVSSEEISGLHNLAKEIKVRGVMVEIGCGFGESTEIFSNYFSEVHAIDPWLRLVGTELVPLKEAENAFDVMQRRHQNIIKLKGIDTLYLDRFPSSSLDFIYIDAEHDYVSVKKQINDWWSKVRKFGVIGGHDYNIGGVEKAVNEIFGKPDKIFEDTSWMVMLG